MQFVVKTNINEIAILSKEVKCILDCHDFEVENDISVGEPLVDGSYKFTLQLSGLKDEIDAILMEGENRYVIELEMIDNQYIWSTYYKQYVIRFNDPFCPFKVSFISKYTLEITKESPIAVVPFHAIVFPKDIRKMELFILTEFDFLTTFHSYELELVSEPPLDSIFCVVNNEFLIQNYLERIKTAVWTIKARQKTKVLNNWETAFGLYYSDNTNSENFLKYIFRLKQEYSQIKHRAFYTSIVNGSGIGKSTLMYELSLKHAHVIYCCLRPNKSKSVPPRSKIADKLLFVDSNIKSCHYVERFCAYFIAAFSTFVKYQCPNVKTQWTSADFQDNLLAEMDIQIIIIGKIIDEKDKPVSLSNIDGYVIEDHDYKNWKKWHYSLEKHVSLTLQGLKQCNDFFAMDKMNFFVFDEARAFILDKSAQHELFSFLQYAFTFFDGAENFMGILLDTLSKVSDFQPADFDPSMRIPNRGKKLLDPWFAINTIDTLFNTINLEDLCNIIEFNDKKTFNTLMNTFQKSTSKSMNNIWIAKQQNWKLHIGMMAFGRPLWLSHLLGALKESIQGNYLDITKACILKTFELASCKLQLLDSKLELRKEAKLALLSIVLGCRLKLRTSMAETLISDLMAYCFYISDDRKTLMCGYTSEPILANASSDLLYFSKEEDQDCLFRTVFFEKIEEMVRYGLIDLGEVGELIARFLLILVMYSCQMNVFVDFPTTKKTSLNTISVESFLNTMLNIDLSSFSDDLLTGALFFNHFMGVEKKVNFKDIPMYYARCAAILCKTNNGGVDLILPVLLNNATFSFILVQVKFYSDQSSSTTLENIIKCNPIRCGILMEHENTIPYIALVMELGGKKSEVSVPSVNGVQHSIVVKGLSCYKSDKPLTETEISLINKLKNNNLADLHKKNSCNYNYLQDIVDPIHKEIHISIIEPKYKKKRDNK